MKNLLIITCLSFTLFSCSNTTAPEVDNTEETERELSDKKQIDRDQEILDSIMKVEESKLDSLKK